VLLFLTLSKPHPYNHDPTPRLYVSQPKGVGFSYCEDMSVDCINNDVIAAEDAYDFFVNFFAGYPEFAKNEFYLTAESYGGIYIPMFMDQIDQRGGVNLKGSMLFLSVAINLLSNQICKAWSTSMVLSLTLSLSLSLSLSLYPLPLPVAIFFGVFLLSMFSSFVSPLQELTLDR
jgi:hypothetical protein